MIPQNRVEDDACGSCGTDGDLCARSARLTDDRGTGRCCERCDHDVRRGGWRSAGGPLPSRAPVAMTVIDGVRYRPGEEPPAHPAPGTSSTSTTPSTTTTTDPEDPR